jgi:hypothetical protein
MDVNEIFMAFGIIAEKAAELELGVTMNNRLHIKVEDDLELFRNKNRLPSPQ